MFDYLDYKNRIPLEKCLIEIPKINPLSIRYEKFWIEVVKRKLIEGHWVSHEEVAGQTDPTGKVYEQTETVWKWLPGPIFQYVNLWNIEMGQAEAGAAPEIGRPRLRDIEWIKGFVHAWAMGFSGFADDDEYTCNRIMEDPDFEDKIHRPYYKRIKPTVYRKDGTKKEYMEPLAYLYRYPNANLGKPLYLQEARNVCDIECRNIGKSMISGNFAGHNFLTDGIKDFDAWYDQVYLEQDEDKKRKPKTDTLISAIDSKYVNGLTSKIKTGLEHLPGGMLLNDVYYPAPMSKTTAGQWNVGKDVVAEVEKNVGGKWLKYGSRSRYLFRSFNDNIFAANGGRYAFAIIDEIGFMGNLLGAIGQLHETMTKNGWKYGCLWMTGTGGDMDGGATEAVKKVFYDPKAFGCLEFDDFFENTGKKIGFFVPGWMALDEFRDALGNVDRERALKVLMSERLEASKAASKEALNSLLQMKPLKPSEAFLVTGSNIFPVADMMNHLKWLEQNEEKITSHKGELIMNNKGEVEWVEDVDNKITLADFPVKKGKYSSNLDGGIEIWEMPDKNALYGWYTAGIDPYNKDIAPESPSLGSFVMIRRANVDAGEDHDVVVAEYTGRPLSAKTYYENCRRLLLFYGQGKAAAIALHESNFNYIVGEFEEAGTPYLLAKKPNVISANVKGGENQYGFYMGNKDIKTEVEIIGRDWLNKKVGKNEDGTNKLQLQYIYSKPLLRELIAYNEDGNFDRVIAFLLAVLQAKQMHKIIVESAKAPQVDPFFSRKLFTNNRQAAFSKY